MAITHRGRRAYEKGWAIRKAEAGELFAVLGERERADLLAMLDKLAASVARAE